MEDNASTETSGTENDPAGIRRKQHGDMPTPRAEKPWRIVAIVISIILAVNFGPWLIFQLVLLKDHITGADRHLDKAYIVRSPDGRTELSASLDGTVRLTDIRSRHVISTRHVDTVEHRNISGSWVDNDHVGVSEAYRYPLLRPGDYYVWDRTSGSIDGEVPRNSPFKQ